MSLDNAFFSRSERYTLLWSLLKVYLNNTFFLFLKTELIWLNIYKGICFSIPREELIIHNETNDSDKISQLFPFEKTHSNSPEIKALQAPSVNFSRKRSVY